MRKVHWGFFAAGVVVGLCFIIAFFQNLGTLYSATWAFLFIETDSTSGFLLLFCFIGGLLTATFFLMAVRGGRYDPSPTVGGKEQPEAWDRVADQY